MGRKREQEERILLKGTVVLSPLVFRERNLLEDSVFLVDLRLRFPGTEKEKALILAPSKELGWSMHPDLGNGQFPKPQD